MKNPLLLFILFILFLWILLCSFLFKKSCACTHDTAAVPAVIAPLEEDAPISFAITDTDREFEATTTDNLLFPLNNCDFIEPLSERLTGVFGEAVSHLQNNEDRLLMLTGLYKDSETNECVDVQDIGYGRAMKVKSMLVSLGAPEDRIRVKSDMTEVEMHNENVLGGVRYDFISMEERLRMGNITLYFETNANDLSLTNDQQRYFEDLKNFINQNAESKIAISGHTDNVGDYEGNKSLSRRRARFVREYMVENGVPRESIVIDGMGPDLPLDTNDTDEGRAKNRRVEVTIQ